ncbi:hypothetical protein ACR6HW_08610 [Fusibacter sp. JL298sf-3]
MFFPFSRQSKVQTKKSWFSNNDNPVHNHFRFSFFDINPVNHNKSIHSSSPEQAAHIDDIVLDASEDATETIACCGGETLESNLAAFLKGIVIGVAATALIFTGVLCLVKWLRKKNAKIELMD